MHNLILNPAAKNQDFSRLTFFIAVIIIKRTEKAVRETVGLQERFRELVVGENQRK